MAAKLKLTEYLEKAENRGIKAALRLWQKESKRAVKELRESIVDQWFSGDGDEIDAAYSSQNIHNATRFYVYPKLYGDGTGQISITSWVDPDLFIGSAKADAWMERNSKIRALSRNDPSNIYILGLIMYQGIIGLPEKSHEFPERGWVNPHFIQRPQGLQKYIQDPANWSQWQTKVNEITSRLATQIISEM